MSEEIRKLKGTMLMCPECEETNRLGIAQLETIINPIEVFEDGTWDWGGSHDVHRDSDWELIDDEEAPAQFYCIPCGLWFDAIHCRQVDNHMSDRAILEDVLIMANADTTGQLDRIRATVHNHLELTDG